MPSRASRRRLATDADIPHTVRMDTALFTGAFIGALFGLFAMMNPIGNTAIFLGMTEGLPASFRLKAAIKTCVAVFIILEGAIFGAIAILDAFGVSMSAFETAGGIIVLGIGLKMLHGSENPAHSTPAGTDALANVEALEKEVDGKLVVPLAMPILAGPGSITTVVTVAAGHHGFDGRLGTAAGTAVIVLSLFICFAASGAIAKVLTKQAQEILLRFMGMILVAIAVGMISHGVLVGTGKFIEEERQAVIDQLRDIDEALRTPAEPTPDADSADR